MERFCLRSTPFLEKADFLYLRIFASSLGYAPVSYSRAVSPTQKAVLSFPVDDNSM